MKNYKYLIIGNSSSCIGCIEGIREVDRKNKIAVFSKEPYFAYSRPIITYYLEGNIPFEKIYLREENFYEKNNVDLYKGVEVTKIDFENKYVSTNFENISYEKLLIGVGGIPIIPQIKGIGRENVFTFTKIDDAIKVREKVKSEKIKKVCILGGGLIGLKVAEAFLKLNINVIIVELADRILSTVLDEESSKIMQKFITDNGVEILTSLTISEIEGDAKNSRKVKQVILNNGEKLSCDMVIIAIGVRPNLSLVENSKIEIGRGILVDKFMRTNIEDVYSAGDVAEVYDFIQDKQRNILTVPNAYYGGRIAGLNMAGRTAEYDFGCNMNSISFLGYPVISFGDVLSSEKYEILKIYNDGFYRKILLKDNLVKGAIFAGYIERCGIIFGLMKNKINVSDFKDKLLFEDFGLIDIPFELRKRILK